MIGLSSSNQIADLPCPKLLSIVLKIMEKRKSQRMDGCKDCAYLLADFFQDCSRRGIHRMVTVGFFIYDINAKMHPRSRENRDAICKRVAS